MLLHMRSVMAWRSGEGGRNSDCCKMWFVIGFKKEFKYTVVFVEREVRKGDNHLNKE